MRRGMPFIRIPQRRALDQILPSGLLPFLSFPLLYLLTSNRQEGFADRTLFLINDIATELTRRND